MRRRSGLVAATVLVTLVGVATVASADDLLNPAAARQRCFGAASRDPYRPCRNDRLQLEVVPSTADAEITPNAPCTLIGGTRLMHICQFGEPPDPRTPVMALIGDSHASHWRAALEVVAARKRWTGLSNTRSGCSYSAATKAIGEPQRTQCVHWNDDVRQWLAAHPEVGTVFFAQIAGEGVVPSGGRSEYETAVGGYMSAWAALPRSVHHVFVIRDTPVIRTDTLACVDSAAVHRRPAGRVCSVSRAGALHIDPADAAAQRLHSPRVQVLDFNNIFCDPTRCFPVIGGALVYKDLHHLTYVFGRTLGPYVLGAMDRLLAK